MVKKMFYFSVICGLSYYLNAQVGIGTDNPGATLHIVPKNQEDPLKVEGLKKGVKESMLLSVDGRGVFKTTELSTIKSEISGGEGVTGILIDVRHAVGTNPVNVPLNQTKKIPGLEISYTPSVNCYALVNISAVPVTITNTTSSVRGESIQGTIYLLVNNIKRYSYYYVSPYASDGLKNTGGYTTISEVIPLTANNTYNFSVQSKTWRGSSALFNRDPSKPLTSQDVGFNITTIPAYAGAIYSDANSMKSRMTILFYSR